MTSQEFIEKWNVHAKNDEQALESAAEMRDDLKSLIRLFADYWNDKISTHIIDDHIDRL